MTTRTAPPHVKPPLAKPPHGKSAADRRAHGQDEDAAVRLAASPDTPVETLRSLARDARVTVRAAVALNPSTPDAVDASLAGDADARVRQLIGQKLAMLIPGLSNGGQARLQLHVLDTLRRLVEDEADRVRGAIAELVKDMPQAPRDLILRLARDTSVPVSDPVLLLSPVLTSADLLALLAKPPARRTASIIASRQGLQPDVADAIADGGDTEAIRVLLSNHSAQLQEAALDSLISRAANQEAWHEPLVRRPKLSHAATSALSEMVATHLLGVLATRTDLAPDLSARLKSKLEQAGATAKRQLRTPPDEIQRAQTLRASGKLDEASIRAAATRGEARQCAAMLAVAADLPIGVVDRAASLRNAKGIVSLVWLAGLSMDLAVTLQTLVGRVSPTAILRSPDGLEFPLTDDEMLWQVDLLKQMGR